ncbi:MAG: hypothetical protein AAFR27_09995 [Pseudomonadota bacterium]
MTNPTNDINELEALLGHTKAPYANLQHDGALPLQAQQRRPAPRYIRYAAAASLMLGIGFVGLAIIDASGPSAVPQSRLATSLPSSFATPTNSNLTINAGAFSRVRQVPASFQMPTRPSRSSG